MSQPRRLARFVWPWLTIWTLVGLAIRVATVYGNPGRKAGGDPYAYYWGARLLVAGHGFINPFEFYGHHRVLQSAAFAPLYTVLLGIPMVAGLKTYFVTRLWTCIVAAAAVPVVGWVGKEMAGKRAGLIAAALTAIYPNIWMPGEIGAAEAIVPLLVGITLLFAYRLWRQPDIKRSVWFGLAFGALILGRDELALLYLFMFVPLLILARLDWRRRLTLVGVGTMATVVVVGPWVGYNLSRFQKTTFVSNEAGLTMASADCDQTFYGPNEGYWSMPCATDAPVTYNGDESVENAAYQKYVFSYLRHHEGRLLPVTLAKIGRAFGFFHPLQQIQLDSFVETRPHNWALAGLSGYYLLLLLSVGGTVVLRRVHRMPVFPLWVIGLNVVIAVSIAFGNTRYRIPFEVPLVLMSGVALDWVWSRLRPGGDDGREPVQAERAVGEGSEPETGDTLAPTAAAR